MCSTSFFRFSFRRTILKIMDNWTVPDMCLSDIYLTRKDIWNDPYYTLAFVHSINLRIISLAIRFFFFRRNVHNQNPQLLGAFGRLLLTASRTRVCVDVGCVCGVIVLCSCTCLFPKSLQHKAPRMPPCDWPMVMQCSVAEEQAYFWGHFPSNWPRWE